MSFLFCACRESFSFFWRSYQSANQFILFVWEFFIYIAWCGCPTLTDLIGSDVISLLSLHWVFLNFSEVLSVRQPVYFIRLRILHLNCLMRLSTSDNLNRIGCLLFFDLATSVSHFFVGPFSPPTSLFYSPLYSTI